MGLSFLNSKKIVLDKMRPQVASRWDVLGHCYVPVQEKREEQVRGSVAGWQGRARNEEGAGWGSRALSLRISPIPFIRKSSLWLLPATVLAGPGAHWEAGSCVWFFWPEAGLPRWRCQPTLCFRFHFPSCPQFFPSPPSLQCPSQDSGDPPGCEDSEQG